MKSKDYFSNLVKIDFTDEEYEKIKEDYNGLLAMIEKLGEVDTDGVEPLFNSPDYTMAPQYPSNLKSESEGIFDNAKEVADDFFVAPLVIKNE